VGEKLKPDEVIRLLKLEKHPREGGWFKETYRSSEKVTAQALPRRYGADRCFSTLIFYLITEQGFSAFHRVKSDEIFHFYLGDAAILSIIEEDGVLRNITLGQDIAQGEQLQAVVPANCWQGIYVKPGGSWSLVGAGVTPGFEYADFEEPVREALLQQYPDYRETILRLTDE
jgi:predicted cupin superfamily sugar epimerase